MRVALAVSDGQPLRFEPGNFVGIECRVEGLGCRRSRYCIVSPPTDDGCFELLVRLVAEGPLSQYRGYRLRPYRHIRHAPGQLGYTFPRPCSGTPGVGEAHAEPSIRWRRIGVEVGDGRQRFAQGSGGSQR